MGTWGATQEWANFTRAYEVNKDATLVSCSYGLPQLMGFNWEVTAHPSPRDMVLAFQRSCEEQVTGFFGFVRANNPVAICWWPLSQHRSAIRMGNGGWHRYGACRFGYRNELAGRAQRNSCSPVGDCMARQHW